MLAIRPRDPGTGEVTNSPDAVPSSFMNPNPSSISDKLDRVIETTMDTRLAVATIAGEMREVGRRMDVHDRVATDVEHRVRNLERLVVSLDQAQARDVDIEQRVRTLERFRYAVPSVAVLLAVASLALAVWQAAGR